jgi:hypothetical protein
MNLRAAKRALAYLFYRLAEDFFASINLLAWQSLLVLDILVHSDLLFLAAIFADIYTAYVLIIIISKS